jgi:integrase
LISLLAINGLRISEALGADIDALGIERGHRTLDRHCTSRIVRRVARRADITKPIGPHTLRTPSSPPLDAGVPLRDVQEAASHADPRTTMRNDRARVSLDRHATYIVAAYLAGAAR